MCKVYNLINVFNIFVIISFFGMSWWGRAVDFGGGVEAIVSPKHWNPKKVKVA